MRESDDEERRRIKGKSVAETKDQLLPLGSNKIKSSDEVLMVDEKAEDAAKRHNADVEEMIQRERITRSLTKEAIEQQKILMEEAELKKNLNEEGEVDQEVIETLLNLQIIEEVDDTLALVIYNFKQSGTTKPKQATDEPVMKNDERQVVVDEYSAKNVVQILAEKWVKEAEDDMWNNPANWDPENWVKFGKKYDRKRKRGDKQDKTDKPSPPKKQTPIHVTLLQVVFPDEFEDEPEVNEPKNNVLDDLSKPYVNSTEDIPNVDMTDEHREKIQNMLNEAKKYDPRILSLIKHGYKFETLAAMTKEEL